MSSPILESFDVITDLSATTPFKVVLHFNEPVLESGDVTLTQFLSSNDTMSQTVYNLTSASSIVTAENAPDVTISLDETDLDALIVLPPILRMRNTTFIQIFPNAFSDIYGFAIGGICKSY